MPWPLQLIDRLAAGQGAGLLFRALIRSSPEPNRFQLSKSTSNQFDLEAISTFDFFNRTRHRVNSLKINEFIFMISAYEVISL
jgi:hypothetical protein